MYKESDTTSRLHHAVPLVGLRHAAMWLHCDSNIGTPFIDYQLANISGIGTGMVKARGDASFFKQTYMQTDIT